MKKIILMAVALLGMVAATMAQEQNANRHFDKGYTADITLSATTNNIFHFNTSHGYNFGGGFYLGGGAGFGAEWSAEGVNGDPNYVPSLFVDARWSMLNCKVSPFVDVKATQYIDLTAGATNYGVTPSVGLDISRFSLGVGYAFRGDKSGWQVAFGFSF